MPEIVELKVEVIGISRSQADCMSQCNDIYIPKRILFQWHVTDRCNLHCSHCYQDSSPAANPSWDELMEILK